jgi:hypothetical protein
MRHRNGSSGRLCRIDRGRSASLAGAAGATAPSLDKWIQVPFRIGETAPRANYATLVRAVLGSQGVEEQQVREAGTSALGPRIEAASLARSRYCPGKRLSARISTSKSCAKRIAWKRPRRSRRIF